MPESTGILLRREVSTAGKGRVFINNQPATVGLLRLLAPELALVHAQGETLGSFDQAQQRMLLDRYGDIPGDRVAETFAAWRESEARMKAMLAEEQDSLRMADTWRFQSNEITQAEIKSPEEDALLEAEKRILGNAERLYGAAMAANDLLYESEGSTESTIGKALKLVEELARFDPKFAEAAQELAAAKATVEDVSATVRGFAEGFQSGPERLAEIEDRLALLDRLKRKYGKTLDEVVAFGVNAARQLSDLENRDTLLENLRTGERRLADEYVAGLFTDDGAQAGRGAEIGKGSRARDQRPCDERTFCGGGHRVG